MSSTRNPGRFAGLLYVLTSIVGFFAMMYVPSKLIVHGDATATASNIAAHEMLFRLGIAGELVGQAGFIFVVMALYELFKGVNRRHASLMVILLAVQIPIAFLNLRGRGFVVNEIFYGLWLLPLALLVYRSRFLPRFLGVWLALAGIAWVILSLTGVLFPQYEDKVFTYSQPAVLGEIAFMLWLLIKGATPPAQGGTALSSVTA